MKKTILFILIFVITVSISIDTTAQISQSLYNTLESSLKPKNRFSLTDEEKANIIRGYPFLYDSSLDKEVNALIASGKNILATTNNQSLKVMYALAFGNSFANQGDLHEAAKYYKETIDYAGNNSKYNDDAAEAYVQLACIYSVYIQPDSAINWLYKALDLRKQKDSTFLNRVNNAYSLIYEKINLYQQSIDYAKKYNELMDDADKWKEDYLVMWFNIVEMYNDLYRESHQKNYFDSSAVSLDSIIKNAKVDFTQWKTIYYFYKAQLYDYDSQYEKALSLYDSSLIPTNVTNDIGRPNILARCKLAQAICLVKLGHNDAIKIIDTLHLKARDFFSFQLKYQVLYQDAQTKGNWQKALEYYHQYISYTDSLAIIETRGKVFEANQKYSVAEKEAAINNLEKEKLLIEKKDNKNMAITTVIVLVLIIVILLLVWYYKQLQLKKEKEKQQLADNLTKAEMEMENERSIQQIRQEALIKEQREKISKNIHDEINSGLAALRFYITDLRSSATDAKTKEVLGKVEEEAEYLYLQAREFMNNLTASNKAIDSYNVISLLDNLAGRFDDESILHILNNIDTTGIKKYFTSKQHYEMYSIINEAVANIIKHASASTATISISFDKNKCLFSIIDNGKGFNRQQIKEGLGLKSLESRIRNELKGELKIISTPKGTTLDGSFPVI